MSRTPSPQPDPHHSAPDDPESGDVTESSRAVASGAPARPTDTAGAPRANTATDADADTDDGPADAGARSGQARPRRAFWRGAAVAVMVVTAALFGWAYADQMVPGAQAASLQIAGTNLAVGVVAGLVVFGLAALVSRWKPVPALYLGTLVAALVLLVTLGPGASRRAWLVVVVVALVAATLIGGAIGAALGGGSRSGPPERASGWRRWAPAALAVVVLAAGAAWLFVPRSPRAVAAVAEGGTGPLPAAISGPDPSTPGPHRVGTLTYGSGTDRRPEYGERVAFRTGPVDASTVVQGWSDGQGAARTELWGFDARAFPLNGSVWFPEGEGTFPLVLLVHGNKSDAPVSEPGYAYLGELLASRGYVAVSIDENYLNTGLLDRNGGIAGAEVARGWLVLHHLREWRDNPDNPLRNRVDMSRIALVGHSRGGEAMAVAASLNAGTTQGPPAVPGAPFAIRSVVGIAPSASQYRAGQGGAPLQDVNYLVIQGSHDLDVLTFEGLDQYQRTQPPADGFKAAVYVQGANHTQFNTLWGNRDVGFGLPKYFIDGGQLLPADAQQKVAKVYLAAFLDATLGGDAKFRALFSDHRAGRQWLPGTRYANLYATAAPEVPPVGERQPLPRKVGEAAMQGSVVAWTAPEAAQVTVPVPAPVAGARHLRIDVASLTGEDVPLSVTIRDRNGTELTAPEQQLMAAPAPLGGRALLAGWMHGAAPAEPVPQTVTVPLDELRRGNPTLDPASISEVTVRFHRPTGRVWWNRLVLDPT